MPDLERSAEAEKVKAPRKAMEGREKAIMVARRAFKFNAGDLVVLDVSRISSFADYFVICSGKSSRQVQGIADNLASDLRDSGIKPGGTEGEREGHWVLMDYGDVIVHVFYEPVRHFYDLESLWSDAPKVEWEEGSDSHMSEANQ